MEESRAERRRRFARERQARYRQRLKEDKNKQLDEEAMQVVKAYREREKYAKNKMENGAEQQRIQEKRAETRQKQQMVAREQADYAGQRLAARTTGSSFDNCRICLKVIGRSDTRVIISSGVRKQFLEVTQTTLVDSEKLSKVICTQCHKELKTVSEYRQRLIETQQKLMDEIEDEEYSEEETFMADVKVETIIEEEEMDEDYTGFVDEEEFMTPMEPPDLSTYDGRYTRLSTAGTQPEMAIIKGSFTCNYCGIKLLNKKTLDQHIITQHNQSIRELKGIVFCKQCGETFASAFAMRKHIFTKHGIKISNHENTNEK